MSLERCEILTDAKSGLGAQGEKTQGLSQGVAAKKVLRAQIHFNIRALILLRL